MRMDIQGGELTQMAELVTKTVTDEEGDVTVYGLCMILDRFTITFWVPWSRAEGHDYIVIREALVGLLRQLDVAAAHAEEVGR